MNLSSSQTGKATGTCWKEGGYELEGFRTVVSLPALTQLRKVA